MCTNTIPHRDTPRIDKAPVKSKVFLLDKHEPLLLTTTYTEITAVLALDVPRIEVETINGEKTMIRTDRIVSVVAAVKPVRRVRVDLNPFLGQDTDTDKERSMAVRAVTDDDLELVENMAVRATIAGGWNVVTAEVGGEPMAVVDFSTMRVLWSAKDLSGRIERRIAKAVRLMAEARELMCDADRLMAETTRELMCDAD